MVFSMDEDDQLIHYVIKFGCSLMERFDGYFFGFDCSSMKLDLH